jgi:uncharacterized protein (TIGR03435 family)
LVAFTIVGAFAQSVTERPRFEVASIKMYSTGSPPQQGFAGSTPDGFKAQYTKLESLLQYAYDVPGQVKGPDWIYERYDITAKAVGPLEASQVKLMLQALLEDRFGLKLHREVRELPVVVLVIGKNGPKNLVAVQSGGPTSIQLADGQLIVKNASMPFFASRLGNYPPYGVNEQVVDQTALKGVFDITLNVKEFNSDHEFDLSSPGKKYEDMRTSMFVFLSAALEKSYGLKLERRKVPLESLIVDGGNKVPTEN